MSSGWLSLLAITIRLGASCPLSCSACSPDVTLCQRLTYIPAAPVSTRALMVTDGFIITVEGTNLSFLLNVTVLTLSRNCITDIGEDAFHGLPGLQILLLERNQLSSSSITNATFQELRNLQVLSLSDNLLDGVQGTWFRNTKGLLRLLLNGNRIRNLTQSAFVGADLAGLGYLDLSNNFISYLGEGAFRALPGLREVDLSRNKLAHIPDVFAPLTQIILRGLERNEWGCACDLHPSAPLLRNSTTNSSGPTLSRGKDLDCRSPAAAVAAYAVLRRSETDCDYKSPNTTLVFRDKASSRSGGEVAQVTVLCFAGAVGLTCLILAILNWKLQRGRARPMSESPCCRALGESLCSHELRDDFTQQYCNCYLTRENEIKVMAIVGSGKEVPLLQENCHPAMLERASESTGLKASFRNLAQGKGCGPYNSPFLCFNCRQVQPDLPECSGNMLVINEASPLTRHFQRRVGKLRHFEPGEIQTQTFQWNSKRTLGSLESARSKAILLSSVSIGWLSICSVGIIELRRVLNACVYRSADIGSNTLNGRGSMPTSALARESLETHLTNELWQPPTETGDDGFQPHHQRHFITSSTAKHYQSKERQVQKNTRNPSSRRPGPHGLLWESKLMDLPPDNPLVCKYGPWDHLQDRTNEKKSSYRERLKTQKDQSQVNRIIKNLSSRGNVGLSTQVQKPHIQKRVSFHIPDLDEEDGLALLLTDSTEAGALWTQQQNSHEQVVVCHSEKLSKMQEKSKGGKGSSDAQIPEKEQSKASYPRRKVKGQNLNIKLNLHPFRKLRIHPEKQPDGEKCPPKSSRRGRKVVQQKSSKVSEEEAAQKERQRSLVGIRGPPEQTENSGNSRTVPKTLTPNAANTQVLSRSQRIQNVAPVTSRVSMSPREHSPHVPDQVPGQSHADRVASSPSIGILTAFPPQSSSMERRERAATLSSLVFNYSSGGVRGSAKDDFKPQHFQAVADQVTPEATEAGESHMSQYTLGQKEKDNFITSRNETQPECDFKPDTNQKDISPEEMLPYKLQHSRHLQLGTEKATVKSNTKAPSPVAKCCITNGGPKSLNKNVSRVESYDCSLIPQTQANSDITFVETNFIPHQNRLECPNDINISPLGTQTNWHPTSRSEKGTDSANGLPRDDGNEAPRGKGGAEESQEAAQESSASHGTVIQAKEMVITGTAGEAQESQKNGQSEVHAFPGSSVFLQSRSPDMKTRLLPSETDPQICHHMRKDVQEIQAIRPGKGDEEHGEEDVMPPEKHGDAFLLPDIKDGRFEAENEEPLIPNWGNDAENSAEDPTLLLPSAECANPSPLAAEQSEPNNSNNNCFPS
ncbi:leucine-rich repeat-containing protein 53 [Phascolarctos cinereus]